MMCSTGEIFFLEDFPHMEKNVIHGILRQLQNLAQGVLSMVPGVHLGTPDFLGFGFGFCAGFQAVIFAGFPRVCALSIPSTITRAFM